MLPYFEWGADGRVLMLIISFYFLNHHLKDIDYRFKMIYLVSLNEATSTIQSN